MEFKFICKDLVTGIEVYARFTGWEDTVQYKYIKDGEKIGQTMIESYNEIQLKNVMYYSLLNDFIKEGLESSNLWSEK